MADIMDTHPPRGPRGYQNNRKRRNRDDDDYDRRPQRRRYEEPLHAKLRRQFVTLAESSLRDPQQEIADIAKTVAENYFDDELQKDFYEALLLLIVEQPLKIPFAAAVVLNINTRRSEVTQEILSRVGDAAQRYLDGGLWREVKLVLRFLGALQGLFEGDGILPILEDLFSRAADLQTASSEDAVGLELVKVILFTIPYIMVSSASGIAEAVGALLEKTDIIASTPHALEALVDPYVGDEKPVEVSSVISIMQKQLSAESEKDWELSCLPRPWKMAPAEDGSDLLAIATKHPFPSVKVPDPVLPGTSPRFPELTFSVYERQDIETVPPHSDVASSLIRDALIDTINSMDFNRYAAAKALIDVDSYFSAGTFIKRATPYDRLKEVSVDKPAWKTEDIAVDAVFSQLFTLPAPPHKLVYYHAILAETCKIAPAAIAPSLGRAIRFLYQDLEKMDMELGYRFLDWFSHHLSNFGFTWKWTEWEGDVQQSDLNPRKSFIKAAIEKEIRLSFAQRIRGTLPASYQSLITEGMEQETPIFKFDSEQTPFSREGKELVQLIRKRAPESEIQSIIDRIQEQAADQGMPDTLLCSTDVYVTAICLVGSKSLSHALSCIERCKERLLAIGNGKSADGFEGYPSQASDAGRKQIITSVMEFWNDQPGIGINIIDKLLNYTILTPVSVIEWTLLEHNDRGRILASSHIYEMISTTMGKVTNRVRQIVLAREQESLPEAQVQMLDETLSRERSEQASLFRVIEEALTAFAEGVKDELVEMDDYADGDSKGGQGSEQAAIRRWGDRWLRVFRRKLAIEETIVGDILARSKVGTAPKEDAGIE